MKKLIFYTIIFTLIFTIISCSTPNNEEDEYKYVKQIAALEDSMRGVTVGFDTLHEMISHTQPNLIVRCKILSRDEVTIKHPSDFYTTDDLTSDDPEVMKYLPMYITTPYDMEILDVYMGETNQKGDVIKFYAPYGIIGELSNRRDHHPIFKVGEEYIILMRADMFNDVPHYYLSYTPSDVLLLNPSDGTYQLTNEGFIDLYAEYENNTEKLIDGLKDLIETHHYKFEPEYIYR